MKLYNSLTNKFEDFSSETDEVKMYVCGVTPYDTNHLGHIFVFLVFDEIRKKLIKEGYNVRYIKNVTDVDSPLYKKAEQTGKNWRSIRDKWVAYMHSEMKILGIEETDHLIYASQELYHMQYMILSLLIDGFAYVSSGNIYFDTTKFPDYGKLISEKYRADNMTANLESISAGEFGGNNLEDPLKKFPLDFPLWFSKENLIKENEPIPEGSLWTFEDPLKETNSSGKKEDHEFRKNYQKIYSKVHKSTQDNSFLFTPGRPGWHIECSAMSHKYLGDQIDIHGGGADLLFPHHESEIAQSECFTGKSPFARYWVHVGMVSYAGSKMSKSKGNLVSVTEILNAGYSPTQLRTYLLSKDYTKNWEFSWEDLKKFTSNLPQFDPI